MNIVVAAAALLLFAQSSDVFTDDDTSDDQTSLLQSVARHISSDSRLDAFDAISKKHRSNLTTGLQELAADDAALNSSAAQESRSEDNEGPGARSEQEAPSADDAAADIEGKQDDSVNRIHLAVDVENFLVPDTEAEQDAPPVSHGAFSAQLEGSSGDGTAPDALPDGDAQNHLAGYLVHWWNLIFPGWGATVWRGIQEMNGVAIPFPRTDAPAEEQKPSVVETLEADAVKAEEGLPVLMYAGAAALAVMAVGVGFHVLWYEPSAAP